MELTTGGNTALPATKLGMAIQFVGCQAAELDFSAYLLSQQNLKFRGDDDMVFYGQMTNINRSVSLSESGSNTVLLSIDLPRVDANVAKIAICATVADTSKNFASLGSLQIKVSNGSVQDSVSGITLTDSEDITSWPHSTLTTHSSNCNQASP